MINNRRAALCGGALGGPATARVADLKTLGIASWRYSAIWVPGNSTIPPQRVQTMSIWSGKSRPDVLSRLPQSFP